MANNVTIDQLPDVISQELTLYNRKITDELKKTAKKCMSNLVKETKNTAPVGHRYKHYRDSITSKTVEETGRSVTYAWYVKGSDYRLSHLLEKGHALRDGGRYPGTGFISRAEQSAIEEYERKIEEVIRNG